jgi:hypothetical protein
VFGVGVYPPSGTSINALLIQTDGVYSITGQIEWSDFNVFGVRELIITAQENGAAVRRLVTDTRPSVPLVTNGVGRL